MNIKECIYVLYVLSSILLVSAMQNAIYDPLKGTYLDSFQDSSGTYNCSIYFSYKTMFYIDNCNSSSSFIRGLNFTFDEKPVPRVVYAPFGVLLEVEKVDWLSDLDNMFLNITSEDDPTVQTSIDIFYLNQEIYSFFGVPTLQGLGALNDLHVESSDSNILMNTKIIMILYLEFENYFGCDAYFWVGKGEQPDRNGTIIPDENGSLQPLGNYYKKTITLRLPRMNISDPGSPEMTIYDIDYLGIFCPDTNQSYGKIDTNSSRGRFHPVKVHPPFIFDRFFLGEDIIFCLPNGTYSRELNLDDTKTQLPCLGRCSKVSFEAMAIVLPLLLTIFGEYLCNKF